MKVAIVGSRDFVLLGWVGAFVKSLDPGIVIVSGGARGVDRIAEQTAKDFGLATEIYPADWEKYGKRAGFLRNQQIVDAADGVVAFWDGRSRGTADTLHRARLAKKPWWIFRQGDKRAMIDEMAKQVNEMVEDQG